MTLSSDLNQFAKDEVQRGASRLDETASKLKDSAGVMQARIGDLAEEARTYADRTADQLTAFGRTALEKAKERPGVSIAVVLGVGVAVGAILALALREPASRAADSALDGATRLRRKLHA